jgi:hypothetical protein
MLLSLKRLLRVCAVAAAWLLFNFGFLLLASFIDSWDEQRRFASTVGTLLAFGFFCVNLFLLGFSIYYRHRRRDLWMKEEAQRWLARRRKRSTQPVKGHQKAWRRMLWIPSTLALLVFLFLPESMGVVSHLFVGRTFNLNNHYLRTPLTSFVTTYRNLYVGLLIGRGIGRVGLLPYVREKPPLSSIFFYAIQDPSNDNSLELYLGHEHLISERTLSFGNETLTCWHLAPRAFDPASDFVRIRCLASRNDFTAVFEGLRGDEATFYNLLETAK